MVRASQKGFVFVATLWVLVSVLLLAAGFDRFVSGRLESAVLLREKIQNQLDAISTEESLKYLLATQRQTLAGLTTQPEVPNQYIDSEGMISLAPVGGELRLDGTLYQGFGEVHFSLQDEGGLIPLNAGGGSALRILLRNLGASAAEVERLVDAIRDYTDADDFRHLNGAEHPEYKQKGMEVPANDFMRSPGELVKVFSWQDWLAQHPEFDYINWCSDDRNSAVNFNTMPVDLLRLLLGNLLADVPRLLAVREETPMRTREELDRYLISTLGWQEEEYRFFASNRIRLKLWPKDGRQALVIGLELSALDLTSPIKERYRYSISQQNVEASRQEYEADAVFQRILSLSANAR